MKRATAALVLLATLTSVSNACPWFRCCSPRPVVVQPVPTLVVPETPSPAPEKKFDPIAVYQQAVRSCVFIVTPGRGSILKGSGALIDIERRLVITTHSAVGTESTAFVQFPLSLKDGSVVTDRSKYLDRIPAGQAMKGKILYRDASRDLALIQLDKVPDNTPAVPLAKASPQVGETVICIGGNPTPVDLIFGFAISKVRVVGIEDVPVMSALIDVRMRCKVITIAAATSDTGGVLVDQKGKLVGVSEGQAPRTAARNLTLSIDISEVQAFLSEKKVVMSDTAEDERSANLLFARARILASGEENRPDYKLKLREVITKYPGTAAAKEAKKILETLK